jgi:hypothetical protein
VAEGDGLSVAAGEPLISYCVNPRDFGHMAASAWIYRPRSIRVPLESLPVAGRA